MRIPTNTNETQWKSFKIHPPRVPLAPVERSPPSGPLAAQEAPKAPRAPPKPPRTPPNHVIITAMLGIKMAAPSYVKIMTSVIMKCV